MIEWPHERDLATYYGDPDVNSDGRPDPAWEKARLERVTPPWRMVASWKIDAPIRSIWIHKRCAASLKTVLQAIFESYGRDHGAIEHDHLHLFGGAYNFRLMRGATKLSTHAYGCAVDLDPDRNGMGSPWRANAGMMPERVIQAFKAERWTWGGDFAKRPDPMHFQAAFP